jgi:hypothetical protein
VSGLFEACLRVPTVFFSIALGIVTIYWLFVLIGALDIDLFGGDASGAAKGIGEALSATKGIGDALAAGKGVGDALAAGKGVGDALAGGKGVGDALAGGKAAGEAVTGHGHGHGHGHDVEGGFWNALGLATVPITISGSVVVIVGWALSIMGMHYGARVLGGHPLLLALSVVASTLLVGLPISGLLVRPLNPIFKLRAGKSNRDYVGVVCTITTGQVDQSFGQATVQDGGNFLVIPVRCDTPDALKRGQQALIIDFDPDRHVYVVEPTETLGLPPKS